MTATTKAAQIKREWHLVDVKDKTLGRVATQIALLLMGKKKPYFVRHLDCGDYVVVVNAKAVTVTGKKEEKKKYYRHSGFPGGLRVKTFKEIREEKPQEIVRHAVKGMLPQNRLRGVMLKRLFVFAGAEHKYEEKFKGQNAKVKSAT